MFVEAVVRWGAWSALLLWMGVAAGASVVKSFSWPCPQRCDCRQERLEVNCSGRQLTAIPEAFPRDSLRLDLAWNRLKMLGRRQFSALAQLQELDLSNNILSMIEVEAFQGLQYLHTLRIRNNRLKIIPVGVFSGLPSLRLLDISENEILVFLDYTFRELASLQRLEAGENDLVFISHRAFVGLSNLQELNLDRCNLTSIPTEALSQLQGLTRLRFRRLNLSMLPNNSFRRLGRLRTLTISHCPWLDTLAANSLFGLNLTSLTITSCNLTAVPYAPVHHLVYLRYLDLSYNPITTVQGNLLGDLLRLQEFHLVGSGLLRIEPGAFRGLVHFHLLNVSSNKLATLEEGVFHSVGNLETLRLDGNPLACDCRLLWVVRRRLRLDFDGRQPACSAPLKVQGREFRDFSEAELPGLFTCRPARILNRKPQEMRVEEGHTVLFFCKADGDPAPSITWLTPQMTVVTPTGRIRVLPNGTLEVRYAQVQDSGTYLCVASNAAGNESFSVGLHVRGFSSARNRTAPFFPEGWALPSSPPATNSSVHGPHPFPFDAKTLIIAVTMGFISFLSSVVICFVFMFFWSQSKGQIKHTATIDFVPRTSMGTSGHGGDRADTGRFTMKLI
ncbi:leucine-rich repeat and immunoglobulin-like domain-containing nogo receptor-interacting protein 1 [Megalops cyprinoides]|uniref:leucine-rich repeat and immunoglobulin-like domain-containing nogo receptor-interacting protein 1 n=1 Tax=Megalops cyprinoides TaxID=118141 RepID=UPI001863E401|nr:leucine-rich repeat and immunoglobulin-like domain-containing nogo receptor-interacting protein 1 [Megalops cyprinoides]